MLILIPITLITISIALVKIIGKDNSKELLYQAISEKIDIEIKKSPNLPMDIQYTNAVYSTIEFKILSYTKETANIQFTYVNVVALADLYPSEITDIDKFYKYCIEKIESEAVEKETKVIEVSYISVNENGNKKFLVEDTPELADVLTGGAYSEYQRLVGGEN